ncbi:MAG: glycosyltransferase family 9 protein [Candidatus Aenigmatarchaeota archaeon]
MKIEILRWLDKHIGTLICFVLTLHHKTLSFLRSEKTVNTKKILFIKLSEQGSTILAYPTIKEAIKIVGRQNVYFLVFKENREILDILEIIPQKNIFEINHYNIFTFLSSILKTLLNIKKNKIDTCIDMEFFSRFSAILAYLCKAKKRVGFHRFNLEAPYRGDLFTHRLLYNPYLHTKTIFLCLLEAVKFEPIKNEPIHLNIDYNYNYEIPQFLPTEKEKKAIIEKIERIKKAQLTKPIFIFNPQPQDILNVRNWPLENYIQLGKKILKEYPQASIIISGTSKEKEKIKTITKNIPETISLAGLTSLRELLTLYCIADVLITHDCGPAHFSSITPIKTIVLFGPETPLLFSPISKNKKIIYHRLACSPCINVYNQRYFKCKTKLCIKEITVEQVYKEIKNFLK